MDILATAILSVCLSHKKMPIKQKTDSSKKGEEKQLAEEMVFFLFTV